MRRPHPRRHPPRRQALQVRRRRRRAIGRGPGCGGGCRSLPLLFMPGWVFAAAFLAGAGCSAGRRRCLPCRAGIRAVSCPAVFCCASGFSRSLFCRAPGFSRICVRLRPPRSRAFSGLRGALAASASPPPAACLPLRASSRVPPPSAPGTLPARSRHEPARRARVLPCFAVSCLPPLPRRRAGCRVLLGGVVGITSDFYRKTTIFCCFSNFYLYICIAETKRHGIWTFTLRPTNSQPFKIKSSPGSLAAGALTLPQRGILS